MKRAPSPSVQAIKSIHVITGIIIRVDPSLISRFSEYRMPPDSQLGLPKDNHPGDNDMNAGSPFRRHVPSRTRFGKSILINSSTGRL